MTQDEIALRYGNQIAERIAHEIGELALARIHADDLAEYLQDAAEKARETYESRLVNPYVVTKEAAAQEEKQIEALRQKWVRAEELAYMLVVADEFGGGVRRYHA